MYAFITTIHVLTCVVLVLAVLLQTGKGADIGAVFGGSSTTIFGSSGAGNFLTKVTTGAAILFMGTSLILTYGSLRRSAESVVPQAPVASQPAGGEIPSAEIPAPIGAGGEEAQPGTQAAGAQPTGSEGAPPSGAQSGGEAPEAVPASP